MAKRYEATKGTIEECYGIEKQDVKLTRHMTETGRHLECFSSPGNVLVAIDFPEFTCLCPRTGHPDFANVSITYIPSKLCVELKSWKYYLNSFRNEGHFHEEVIVLIEKELRRVLNPVKLAVVGEFNRRGGTEPYIEAGDRLNEAFK